MENFYYVAVFNLNNLKIKKLLSNLENICLNKDIIEIKIKSKFYLTLSEAMIAARIDFLKKYDIIYIDDPLKPYNFMSINNPKYMSEDEYKDSFKEGINLILNNISKWDERCHSVLFFGDTPNELLEDEDVPMDNSNWLIKYELFFESEISETKNGEHLTTPSSLIKSSSTYQ